MAHVGSFAASASSAALPSSKANSKVTLAAVSCDEVSGVLMLLLLSKNNRETKDTKHVSAFEGHGTRNMRKNMHVESERV